MKPATKVEWDVGCCRAEGSEVARQYEDFDSMVVRLALSFATTNERELALAPPYDLSAMDRMRTPHAWARYGFGWTSSWGRSEAELLN
eukprot:CAMPEP_0204040510 /NCGR_PEP_ID=MMETSP0360-20130528/92083_1 /ASSEMBLY_ACC=CAM_ASM_000342 /TAXON_ID=268821 /ORGANISM="Scrippsiella Hangoei, Strain SHTV-5" /LENGTH=87 /DNA_ID=CAMNT_0050986547 /DNA_START=105 /DNA_END=366 /DNA_ORIENTATION=+